MRCRRGACAFALIGLCALHGSGVALAQGPATADPVSVTIAATEQLSVPAGQEIAFEFRSALSSQRSRVGDPVEIVVVRDAKVDGLTVIAAGSIGQGKVTGIKRRGHKGKPGRIEIEFSEVRSVNGARIRLAGQHQVSGEDRREQVKNDAGGPVFEGLGFGAMLIPIALLERGGSERVTVIRSTRGLRGDHLSRAERRAHRGRRAPSRCGARGPGSSMGSRRSRGTRSGSRSSTASPASRHFVQAT